MVNKGLLGSMMMNKNLINMIAISSLTSLLVGCGTEPESGNSDGPSIEDTMAELASGFTQYDTNVITTFNQSPTTTNCDNIIENAYGTRVCVTYAGQDVSNITTEDVTVNDLGIDYSISVGGLSNLDTARDLLTDRIGTPVVDQFRTYAFPLIDKEAFVPEYAETNVRNHGTVNCYLVDPPSNVFTFSSESGLDGFTKFKVDKYSVKTNIPPSYLDENNNYDLGNVLCEFTNTDTNVTTDIIVGEIAGNDDDDHINFPNY